MLRGAVLVIWGEIEMWERFRGRQGGITDGNIATSQLSTQFFVPFSRVLH